MAEKPTNPRKYDRRIQIQKKQVKLDPEGFPTGEEWVTVSTPWAKRKPLTTRWREYFQAGGENAEKMFQYELRYREDVSEEMRIVDGKRKVSDQKVDRIFEIKAVLDDVHGDRTETWIMALELTGG